MFAYIVANANANANAYANAYANTNTNVCCANSRLPAPPNAVHPKSGYTLNPNRHYG